MVNAVLTSWPSALEARRNSCAVEPGGPRPSDKTASAYDRGRAVHFAQPMTRERDDASGGDDGFEFASRERDGHGRLALGGP